MFAIKFLPLSWPAFQLNCFLRFLVLSVGWVVFCCFGCVCVCVALQIVFTTKCAVLAAVAMKQMFVRHFFQVIVGQSISSFSDIQQHFFLSLSLPALFFFYSLIYLNELFVCVCVCTCVPCSRAFLHTISYSTVCVSTLSMFFQYACVRIWTTNANFNQVT